MTVKFKEKFNDFICVGDSVSIEHGEWRYTCLVNHDPCSSVADYDCYSQIKINQWLSEGWFFCGLVIDAYHIKTGLRKENICSLWAIECNFNKKANRYLNTLANDLLNEAINGMKNISVTSCDTSENQL